MFTLLIGVTPRASLLNYSRPSVAKIEVPRYQHTTEGGKGAATDVARVHSHEFDAIGVLLTSMENNCQGFIGMGAQHAG